MLSRHARSRGFTMVELLIAGLMSAFVLLAVYFVFITNSTQYYRQEQLVQLQESMRFATELLKNDLRNAGRLAVVRGGGAGKDPHQCLDRPELQGVELFENDPATPVVLTRLGNGLRPDRFRLLTDTGVPVMLTASTRPDQITVRPAAQQSTADGRAIARSQARFDSMFQPGLFLRVTTPMFTDLVPINDAAFDVAGSTITLARPMCGRVARASEAWITPVQLVEYAVVESVDDAQRTDLVRRVIDARNGRTELDDLTLTVAEYVVNLQLWGVYGGVPGQVPTDLIEGADAPEDAPGSDRLDLNVHRLRALGVLLAARTPREDADFKVAPDRALNAGERRASERGWFELDDAPGTGLARVATLKIEVEATNAYRGAVDAL